MKKILLILFALSSLSFAQTQQMVNYKGSSLPFQLNPDGTFSLYHYVYMSVNDTLNAVDSTSYNFGNRPYSGFINIYNPKSNADTVSIYYYDVANSRWTSAMSALIDMSTTYPVSNNLEIIIPATTSKRYRVYEQYPGQIKIKTVGLTGQAPDQLIVTLIEKN